MKAHQAAGNTSVKAEKDPEGKKTPKQRNTDVSALYGKDKPTDYYSRKELEKKEKRERAKRLSLKKGVFLTEPKEAQFDAQTEGEMEKESKDLDVDITNDDVFIVHEEDYDIGLIETTPEEWLKAAEEYANEDGGGDEDGDYDDDLEYENEHEPDDHDNDDIKLIKEFEKEIKSIKDSIKDDDDDPEPKPS